MFNMGDIVICVDNRNTPDLTVGNEYVISARSHEGDAVIERDDRRKRNVMYRSHRFVLKSKGVTLPEELFEL